MRDVTLWIALAVTCLLLIWRLFPRQKANPKATGGLRSIVGRIIETEDTGQRPIFLPAKRSAKRWFW